MMGFEMPTPRLSSRPPSAIALSRTGSEVDRYQAIELPLPRIVTRVRWGLSAKAVPAQAVAAIANEVVRIVQALNTR
jgi:hypothetical protein